ncbi:SCO6880 family protein [Jannaschia sp. R86511]|uniref:SCO6880 family protein n=1 Tax=Jannaschia sp. R86511 TaxID=3093853 RepID=UPI0036D3D369
MRTSFLGGETHSRGLLGVRGNRLRTGALTVLVVVCALLGVAGHQWAMVIGLAVGSLVIVVLTLDSPGGTVLERWQARRRWRWRQRQNVTRFVPASSVDADELARLQGLRRRERVAAHHPVRDLPDGVDGLGWLQDGRGVPGIAWHEPAGEDAYLTVVFAVDGQVKGIESNTALDANAQRWGQLLAKFGGEDRLVGRVQTITRVLPVDAARHERWVMQNIDPDAHPALTASYDALIRRIEAGALVSRHFVVARWPLTDWFKAQAGLHGPGQAGWRALMAAEVDGFTRALRAAHFGQVAALSAAQVAAVTRNQQHPGFMIDQAGDVSPATCWLASEDEWSATRVTAAGFGHAGFGQAGQMGVVAGEEVTWWHRTCELPVAAMQLGERTSLWLAPLLAHVGSEIVRSVSLQVDLVPAIDARRAARQDEGTDRGNILREQRKGKMTDADAEVRLEAAARRVRDLTAGGGHHGASWAGHVTISARSREELAQASRRVVEAAGEAGIDRVRWLDTQQAAAQACTWPFTRAMAAPRRSAAAMVRAGVGRGTPKGAL